MNTILGAKPAFEFRTPDEATIDMVQYATGACSHGELLVARSANGICAVLLGDSAEDLREKLMQAISTQRLQHAPNALSDEFEQVRKFIDSGNAGLDLEFDIEGTAFQLHVWNALRGIPAGETRSYAQVATRMGMPGAARAVAAACAANRLAVVIPCHRVVRGDGAIAGYRWGADRKRRLLAAESTQ
jgi:AraC family transcriptional regulator of adaptative response/methylated-DNA-[protein]-cysteine methyltransferase